MRQIWTTGDWLTLVVASTWLAGPTGCTWQKDRQAVEQQADECLLKLKALQEKQAAAEAGRQQLEAQHDRLAAQNRELRGQIEGLQKRQRELEAEVTAARSQKQQVGRDLEAQRKDLEASLARVNQSRRQWEEALADRQRTIDLLTSQLERLRRQIARPEPATVPASVPR